MLLLLRKNGLDSLLKEVRVFKVGMSEKGGKWRRHDWNRHNRDRQRWLACTKPIHAGKNSWGINFCANTYGACSRTRANTGKYF